MGKSLLLPYTLVSLGLDFTQMALDVRNNLKPTQFIILNNFSCNNFPKKSISGDVRAQVLQEPVGASHADQGRKSCAPRTFLDPGGQARSNGTPHLPLASRGAIPQGGSLLYYIYRYRRFAVSWVSVQVAWVTFCVSFDNFLQISHCRYSKYFYPIK